MPPKKAATNGDAGEAGGKFTWEGPNDMRLLLLTHRRPVKTDEYEQLSQAIPGTTHGSIRNRMFALRVKQRELYEQLGWEMPDGAAPTSAKKTKGAGKRGLEHDGDAGAEPETPTKKPRAKKAKKEVKKEEGSDESGGDSSGEKGADVKEEEYET